MTPLPGVRAPNASRRCRSVEIGARVLERQIVRVRRHPSDAAGVVIRAAEAVLRRSVEQPRHLTAQRELHRCGVERARRFDLPDDAVRSVGPRGEIGRRRRVHVARAEHVDPLRADERDRHRRPRAQLPFDADAVLQYVGNGHVVGEADEARRLGAGGRIEDRVRIRRVGDDVALQVQAVVPQHVEDRAGPGSIVEDAGAASNHRAGRLAS